MPMLLGGAARRDSSPVRLWAELLRFTIDWMLQICCVCSRAEGVQGCTLQRERIEEATGRHGMGEAKGVKLVVFPAGYLTAETGYARKAASSVSSRPPGKPRLGVAGETGSAPKNREKGCN